MTTHYKQIADWLRTSAAAVGFTGAGISTDSGIPDFRSPGGVWATSQPVYFDEINRDPTPLDRFADAVIHASISDTLAELDQLLEPPR